MNYGTYRIITIASTLIFFIGILVYFSVVVRNQMLNGSSLAKMAQFFELLMSTKNVESTWNFVFEIYLELWALGIF